MDPTSIMFKFLFVCLVASIVVIVVRGLRRADPILRTLDAALLPGIGLFACLPNVVPHSIVVAVVGGGLVFLRLLWKLVRKRPYPPKPLVIFAEAR
jgi:hypothetical protein